MIDLIEKTVDGDIYKIEQFATSKAIRVLTQLGNICGPSFAEAIAGAGIKDQSEQNKLFGKAVGELLTKMDKDANVALVKDIVAGVLKGEGAKINFEQDFKGRLGHLLKLVVAVLEVNYSNFLEDLLGLLDGLKGSGLSPQSTGVSGA